MYSGLLEELVQQFKRLPGIGQKSAQRLAMFIINQDKSFGLQLATVIKDSVESFTNCSICNMLTEIDPCSFCTDPAREQSQLCVVEHSQDVFLVENTGDFHGRYFVLGGLLSPLDGVGPQDIHFPQLADLISEGEIKEVIMAINPSAEGETTMNYIASQFENSDLEFTRLSTGLPFGSDIEYTSAVTLKNALRRRYSLKK